MSAVADAAGIVLIVLGAGFFSAGTLGLIRFPDLRSRLHALTKADNLGLGLLLGGVAVLWESWTIAGLLLLTWVLALVAASVSAHLLAALNAHPPEYDPTPETPGEPPQASR